MPHSRKNWPVERQREYYQQWRLKSDKFVSQPPETESIMAGYKEPLKSVEDGYGYYGTIAYDAATQTLSQCHLCGHFWGRLGKHVSMFHSMTAAEYREEFGLPRTLSLNAPNAVKVGAKKWSELSIKQREVRLENLKKGREKADRTKGVKMSLYERNLRGSCPDQLLDKIEALAVKLGKRPTRRDFETEYGYGIMGSLYFTYGSWNQALIIVGMAPHKKGMQPTEQYTEEQLIELLKNFQKRYDREPLSDDIERGLLPSAETFKTTFGSFTQAKVMALGIA